MSVAPLEQSSFELYNERTIIDGLFLGAIAYGIHLTLFIWCFRCFLQRKKQAVDYLLMVYISLLFLMGNIGSGTNIKIGELTFVDERNFPGGPTAFFATGGGPVGLTCNVVYIINSWFQDGLLLYRFWMFFSPSGWYWVIVPSTMFVATVALSLILIVMLCIPGITLWSTISIDLAIPYWSISIALNVIITTCIASRLLYMRYQIRRATVGSGSEYISITSMMIESAVLYTVNGLIFLVSYAVNSPVQNLALPVLGQTQSISPLLIILHVLEGRAWSSSSLARFQTGTDVMFNHHSSSVTQTQAGSSAVDMNKEGETDSEKLSV
ncbi:hypothetical protein AGABI2DRAFT_180778 [Agaricus bisporus var. bisporus H97]|uniref:hypothetical protein n=1 Tax=Agaricus bisporus var. bisporus (strain H97 / ATCC MYA-4626 / FGSC 10389) TaxID=936046 RepID=UPI00029F5B9F|nr:hypothetical protein AGABI2DRAFT_180778 [Agaricus bisporus var. bisporus H97]EKV43727.1 hypothetical protein AGABI2DRAFT_180778 [Agaricus bisporus var. bisporus H97]